MKMIRRIFHRTGSHSGAQDSSVMGIHSGSIMGIGVEQSRQSAGRARPSTGMSLRQTLRTHTHTEIRF